MQYAYIYLSNVIAGAAFNALNIACINSIGGMIVTGNRTILGRTVRVTRTAAAIALNQMRRLGSLLSDAAVIAFAIRCKVIDGR